MSLLGPVLFTAYGRVVDDKSDRTEHYYHGENHIFHDSILGLVFITLIYPQLE